MRDRGSDTPGRYRWLGLLVAILFAINVPLSAAYALLAAPDHGQREAPAMSCHEPAGPQDRDHSDQSHGTQHLCCFTACIPLAMTADTTITLALPVDATLLTSLPTRPTPRSVGVDPPPPKA